MKAHSGNTILNWVLQPLQIHGLTEAAAAAKAVMDAGVYSIYTTGGTTKSYRTLFTNATPIAAEVMLAAVMDLTLNELHDANWCLDKRYILG